MLFVTPALAESELAVLAEIDELRSVLRQRIHEPRRWAGSLRRVQLARGVQGSNSIEGFDAALDDALAIDLGQEPLDPDQETEAAIKGYRDAMTFVLQLADESDVTIDEQLLRSLHFMMTGYDLKVRPGRWRAGSIYVHDDESRRVVYEGPEVEHVPPLMRELAQSMAGETGEPVVVRAAMAHLNLVMIHPFRDGNGRMARCLQTLVLARDGILPPVFSSIEEYLGRNAAAYYDVLATVGRGSWQPHNDARPWLRFALTAHLRQASTMLRRAREIERLYFELDGLIARERLPERSIEALFDAASGLRVRNAVYRALVERNHDLELADPTASRDLRVLADKGLLQPVGEKRGRHYVAGPTLRGIRAEIVSRRPPRDDTDPFAEAGG